MLENSPIILSGTSENLYLLFFTIPPIILKYYSAAIPKLFTTLQIVPHCNIIRGCITIKIYTGSYIQGYMTA